jgi:osmotically-inducible protein OsmY
MGSKVETESYSLIEEETPMRYRRQALHHLIVRALQRNTFTANQSIRVVVRGNDVLLHGFVTHADLIPEAVATVEAVAPFLYVYSHLRVRRAVVKA